MTLRYACLLPALLGLFACQKDPTAPAPDTRVFNRFYNLKQGEVTDLQVLPDGHALALGTARSPAGSDQVTLLKLTPSGDTLWTKYLFGGLARRLVLRPDGGVFGSAIQNTGSTWEQVLFRTDAAGRLLWRQNASFYNSSNRVNDHLTLAPDGGCVIVNNSYTSSAQNRYELRKYAADGTLSWSRYYVGTSTGGLQRTPDGKFVLAVDTNNGNPTTTSLVQFDPQGNVLWIRPVAMGIQPSALICLPDSGFAITGTQWVPPYTQTRAALIRTDKAAQPQFVRTYTANAKDLEGGTTLVYTARQEFIIVGQSSQSQTSTQPGAQYSLVLRTTNDGLLISGSRRTAPFFTVARTTPDDYLLFAGHQSDNWAFQKVNNDFHE